MAVSYPIAAPRDDPWYHRAMSNRGLRWLWPFTLPILVGLLLTLWAWRGGDGEVVLPGIAEGRQVRLRTLPGGSDAEPLLGATHPSMGSLLEIQAFTDDPAHLRAVLARAFTALDALEAKISHYQSDSEISKLNRRSGDSRWVEISQETLQLLQISRTFWQTTEGAFDITVGPLVRLWGFFDNVPAWPDESERNTYLERVGMQYLEIDPAVGRARLTRSAMGLDFGAIGKGYAVDLVTEILREGGIQDALISFGGSTHYGLGRPPGQDGWWIFLDESDPDARQILRDGALSTSSNDTRHWVRNGRTYGHVLDPRSGLPTPFLGSVSVLAPSATASDALATAFLVLREEDSRRILASHPEWVAIFLLPSSAASGE